MCLVFNSFWFLSLKLHTLVTLHSTISHVQVLHSTLVRSSHDCSRGVGSPLCSMMGIKELWQWKPPQRTSFWCGYLDGTVACRLLSMPCRWASANLDLSLSTTEQSSQKHITCTASEVREWQQTSTVLLSVAITNHVLNQESVPRTCKTLLSDSSPVLTSTFSKTHFLAVALV